MFTGHKELGGGGSGRVTDSRRGPWDRTGPHPTQTRVPASCRTPFFTVSFDRGQSSAETRSVHLHLPRADR